MAKQSKTKIKSKKSRIIVLVIFASSLLLLIGVFLVLSLFAPKQNSNNKYLSEIKPRIVRVKAKGTPIPSAAMIPQNYGNSVNVPILTYHYIGNNPNPRDKARDNLSVSPDQFEAQMKYLAQNGFTTISLDTLYAALKGGLLPPKPIVLTFDDGYIDFYVNAFPILRRYGLHATSFIPTGLMDQGYYLHWSQIKEMDATGLISFEAHSVHHPNLASLSNEAMIGEISASKKVLMEQLGKPVNFMAYPYGASNQAIWEAAKKAGFFGALGTWGSTIESEGNVYDMPRIKIPGGISVEDFAKRI